MLDEHSAISARNSSACQEPASLSSQQEKSRLSPVGQRLGAMGFSNFCWLKGPERLLPFSLAQRVAEPLLSKVSGRHRDGQAARSTLEPN